MSLNTNDILKTFIEKSSQNLLDNKKMMKSLKSMGIKEGFIFENFNLGFADDNVYRSIGEDSNLLDKLHETGLYKNNNPVFNNHVTIPIHGEGKTIVNIAFFNPDSLTKTDLEFLNDNGIFNYNYLKNSKEVIFTKSPVEALLLIQANYHNTTFIFGYDEKYKDFIINNNITRSILTFEGRAGLVNKLENNNALVDRIIIDFDTLLSMDNQVEYLKRLFDNSKDVNNDSNENVVEIENGFVFTFPHITYRIIGNFYEHSMSLKVNIKAIKNNEVFINSIDLYKNRERQNYIFNLMDRFGFRDHISLENDFNRIIEVIEKYKDKRQKEKHNDNIILTDHQKETGLSLLTDPYLLNEIDKDITDLGYVNERKNKILTYLVMTSRLMNDPLHAVVIARTGAGKSKLIDIIESLCPDNDLKSISDLTSQSLYYMEENELKNKFIVIGEKEGSKDSEYPLRELISKKTISKAVPIKDQVTGIIKTVTIKVNGPIALIETTTSGNLNPENLNRCFIISIDESEEQTRIIQENQRLFDTLEGHLLKHQTNKIIEKHRNAQMLLRNINVFNPYAPLLTFPTQSIQTRRDNQKFLKLIKVICFLHQYQREIKFLKLENNETLEYIECTLDDYKVAYELLIDGILDNSLDDLPRPARELLEIIKKYLKDRSNKENIPVDKIIFTRKEIRDYSNWSFAQVRNNFQTLKDYEYLQLIQSKNGLAHNYRLVGNYSDSIFTNSILTPDELEKKFNDNIDKNNLTGLNTPAYSGKN